MMQRGDAGPVDRFIDAIEVTAAGFLAVVTLLTFVSVILRYFFSWAIPDSYDFDPPAARHSDLLGHGGRRAIAATTSPSICCGTRCRRRCSA